MVHGIVTVGADFKGVRGGQGVNVNPAKCPDDSGHFSCIVRGGRRSRNVGFREVRYDWAILVRVRFGLVEEENSEAPPSEAGWCGRTTRSQAIYEDLM